LSVTPGPFFRPLFQFYSRKIKKTSAEAHEEQQKATRLQTLENAGWGRSIRKETAGNSSPSAKGRHRFRQPADAEGFSAESIHPIELHPLNGPEPSKYVDNNIV
jgi:hypothetical protein